MKVVQTRTYGDVTVQFIKQNSGYAGDTFSYPVHIYQGKNRWQETSREWLKMTFPFIFADVVANPIQGWPLQVSMPMTVISETSDVTVVFLSTSTIAAIRHDVQMSGVDPQTIDALHIARPFVS